MKKLLKLALALVAAVAADIRAQTVDSVITNGLFEPHGVALDRANNIYITDGANNRVVRYGADTGILSAIAGSANFGPGYVEGIGVLARFFDPKGIVFDPVRGKLIVADSGNHVIRLVSTNGFTELLAGVPGQAGLVNGAASAARFSSPSGLAVDTNGVVYVADSKNNAIRRIALNGTVTTFIGSGLYEPGGVSVAENGDVWVADTRNHTIKAYNAAGVLDPARIIGSNSRHVSGFQDSLFGQTAQFNNPRALLAVGGDAGILVSDSGNHVLRRIYWNPEVSSYSVELFAGTPGQAGLVNDALLKAKFNGPIGLTYEVANNGFLAVDSSGSALRRIQISPPRPPISTPSIGWVDFVKDSFGDLVSVLIPVTQSVFNTDVIIAILSEAGTETFFTFGPTPPNPLDDKIPFPSRATGQTPVPYENGLRPAQVGPSIITPQPDVTIKAISSQDGRRPSEVVRARFQFKTSNPVILGDNPVGFVLNVETPSAVMYFTTNGASIPAPNDPNSFGPFATGAKISLPPSDTNIVFMVRAFRANFKDSETITKVFSPSNFVPNRISLGFEIGEASSTFIASPGQRFYAPITMTTLPGTEMYSMQFNVHATNRPGSTPLVVPPNSTALDFESMLKALIGTAYFTIPPALLVQRPPPSALSSFTTPTKLLNAANQHVLVSWNIVPGTKVDYGNDLVWDTAGQHLIRFSIAHDTLFDSQNNKVVLGAFSFVVPPNAAGSDTYLIQINRPSATIDGVNGVYVQSDTNGPLTGLRTVRMGQLRYVVGDVAPFRWFNAGDFGNNSLLSDDVMQIFRAAVYGLNLPPGSTSTPRSDFFDALDSAGGPVGGLVPPPGYELTDIIDGMDFGDGILAVDDIFVTLRRSLDPSRVWYSRYWQGGQRVAVPVPNVARGIPNTPARRFTSAAAANAPAPILAAEDASVQFSMPELSGAPGQTIDVPVRASIRGSLPLRVLLLNLNVQGLDGSPAVQVPVTFTPAAALGKAAISQSIRAGNFSSAWLDSSVEGLRGDAIVGTLRVRIPDAATAASAYRLEFEHASASSLGVGLFPRQIEPGLIMVGDRSASSWNDNIPDSWRLRHFGSTQNLLSHARADADGDGVSNWDEFKSGTSPTDLSSVLRLRSERRAGPGRGVVLRWPSVASKRYIIERSSTLTGDDWTAVAHNVEGTGRDLEFSDAISDGEVRFYRVRLAD